MNAEIIRPVEACELADAFGLIWRVFQEFVAPDYSQEGIDSFYSLYVAGTAFRENFADGRETMLGAFINQRLAGVLSISQTNVISCLFVEGNYHRMGIGKKLFGAALTVLQARGAPEVRLNASPCAVPFYHALGFKDIGGQASHHGIIYTPMRLLLQ